MAEQIIKKACTKCNEIKSLSEFQKDSQRSAKDGHRFWCKECSNKRTREYNHTEKGKLAHKRYKQSDKGKIAVKKYEQSNKGKIVRRRQTAKYRKTHKGKKRTKISLYKWREKYPEKLKAEQQVQYAVHKGVLKPASEFICTYCNAQAEHYHHHLGYEPEHFLDVVPVCYSCHAKIHNTGFLSKRTG